MHSIIFGLIAYLLGSIPSALLIGKAAHGIDVRKHGSGNMGATNAYTMPQKNAGAMVTANDLLRVTRSTLLPILFQADVHPLIIGLFAVLGHTYPLFAKFKGGKAVATSGGIILGIYPLLFILMVVTFFLALYISK